ncbi:hypothetical protein [Streptomyces sp. NPDC005423]|uniref:hypothetical protein n=1 Tax=Streptomyces sp. NPDC005423 TaxID=3155343 RepID=UPI0033A84E79
MAVEQLPGQVREFANHLDGLLARLDQGGGWCGVFWQRDPDGMRACLDGREVPPWDVVEALLQDFAARYGPGSVTSEKERVRALHAAALAASDARPGSRDVLADRLDVMLREQRYAAERQLELGRALTAAATREEADTLRLDLAWAHDDHERATARCAELRSRIAELERHTATGRLREAEPVHRDRQDDVFTFDAAFPEEGTGAGADPGPGARTFPRQREAERGPGTQDARRAPQPDPRARRDPDGRGRDDTGSAEHGHPPAPALAPAPGHAVPESAGPPAKQRRRRRGSARFAGLADEPAAAPDPDDRAAGPDAPAPAAATRRTLRGARFAGGAAPQPGRPESRPAREPLDAEARQHTVAAVRRLVGLRSEGRTGEAHALLVEIAYWPAARFPLLAAELQRAGLGADWATLLWEAASLPPEQLVAAADALAAAGRPADGEQILRQGVARPAAEIGEAVRELVAEDRHREARALLDAYVRVRTPEETARAAEADPRHLVPLLLEAARGVSDQRHWDLVHALRVAGFAT